MFSFANNNKICNSWATKRGLMSPGKNSYVTVSLLMRSATRGALEEESKRELRLVLDQSIDGMALLKLRKT